jgi:hypothetical protein
MGEMPKWDLIEHTEQLVDYDRIRTGIENLQLQKEHPRYAIMILARLITIKLS